MTARITLTLAHSPDPDDVFMWWPITGKIRPDGSALPGDEGRPVIDGGRFEFRPLPADIHILNRRAIEVGDLEITALSARAYAQVAPRYIITRCGASFGDGFGPKVVSRSGDDRIGCEACLRDPSLRIAIPGRQTTAFMLLGLILGDAVNPNHERFIEMPFDRVIPSVVEGQADAGLVIHEGQLTYADAGLRLVCDVGAWWKSTTGLPTPLGVNAIRRDLDERHGPGTVLQVARLLQSSVAHAIDRRGESTAYALPFALANTARGGNGGEPTLERVDRYCRMYVGESALDMGDEGSGAINSLLRAGADAGLCPRIEPIVAI